MDELVNLENFETSISSKIVAIHGVKNSLELEAMHQEVKQLLSKYELDIRRAQRIMMVLPHESINLDFHKQCHRQLLEELHQAIATVRPTLPLSIGLRSGQSQQLIRRRPQANEDPANSLAQDISDTLRNLSGTLHDEVLRSESSYAILQRSSKRLTMTTETYKTMGGLLGISRRLIAGLWNRERMDRWLILATLALFYVIVTYIVIQRMGMLWWVWRGVRLIFSGVWSMFALVLSLFFRSKSTSNPISMAVSPTSKITNIIMTSPNNDATIHPLSSILDAPEYAQEGIQGYAQEDIPKDADIAATIVAEDRGEL